MSQVPLEQVLPHVGLGQARIQGNRSFKCGECRFTLPVEIEHATLHGVGLGEIRSAQERPAQVLLGEHLRDLRLQDTEVPTAVG